MVLDDRYRLVERVGVGGMGVVWRAEDPRLGHPRVRLALAPAFPRDDVHQIVAHDRAVPTTRILPPGVRGHRDPGAGPLGTEPNGDPERARKTLGERAPARELVVAYMQGETNGRERAAPSWTRCWESGSGRGRPTWYRPPPRPGNVRATTTTTCTW
ncbi:hypothetical protein [Streptomyces sp. NPDC015130]|uniref:hypothetical protein n=1 Tax=Streptomyces sp. NPDC015130 TaxID=3364940 RepID=UPI0036F736D1